MADKLHKILADAGLGSRRTMEARIAAGRVSVNGKRAEVGARAGVHDAIRLDGKRVRVRAYEPEWLIYHKPEGEITTRSDPGGRKTVFKALPAPKRGRWIAIGRLDINTEGLLLFTNDGASANQWMHPSNEVLRTYSVRVRGALSTDALRALTNGVAVEGERSAFAFIVPAGGEGHNRWYKVGLREGKNRQVRKLFAAVEVEVSRLIRIQYGDIALPSFLRRGQWHRMAAPAAPIAPNSTASSP